MKLKTHYLLFFISILPLSVSRAGAPRHDINLLDPRVLANVAKSKEWKRLIHFDKRYNPNDNRHKDIASFIISPNGHKNSLDELHATLKSFYSKPPQIDINNHPRCRFPARWRLLKEKLNLPAPEVKGETCTDLISYRKSLAAKSVSLVFSSYYLGNPASMFGHTFLRLNRDNSFKVGNNKPSQLLDSSISYSATPDAVNFFSYIYSGIFGYYRGTFQITPFYNKVQEYNNFEMRDLWSYDLHLNEEEVGQLIDHLWELKFADFNYYFFRENCSYLMLATLEAAIPRLNLTDKLKYWVLPTDTLKIVWNEKNLVQNITFRPSLRTRFYTQYKQLQQYERELVKKGNPGNIRDTNNQLSENQLAKVLDTTLAYYAYKNPRLDEANKPEIYRKNKLLLSQRAKLNWQTQEPVFKIEQNKLPHRGHGSSRFGLGVGNTKFTGRYFEIDFRSSLHDFLDRPNGYQENSSLELFNFSVIHFTNTEKLELDKIMMNVASFNPITEIERNLSWNFSLGLKRLSYNICHRCLGFNSKLGIGYSGLASNITWFSFLDLKLFASEEFKNEKFALGGGPQIGALWSINDSLRFKIMTFYHYLTLTGQPYDLLTQLSLRYSINNDLSLNIDVEQENTDNNYKLTLLSYF